MLRAHFDTVSEEKECMRAGASVSRGVWLLCHVWKRHLDACNPTALPSLSQLCTLYLHKSQPGLTYSKHTATALLKRHDSG